MSVHFVEFECLDMLELTAGFASKFTHCFADPPYSPHVHENAVSAKSSADKLLKPGQQGGITERQFGFGPFTDEERQHTLYLSSHVDRWVVLFSDMESAHLLGGPYHPYEGLEYIRHTVWERFSQPQMTGTMPPQGCEAIVCLHRCDIGPRGGVHARPKYWNGPGSFRVFHELAMRGAEKHPAEKPLDLCLSIVSWFSDPGDIILDPFCGDGSMGIACEILERSYYGCDDDPQCIRIANERLRILTPRDQHRTQTWIETNHEPISQQATGPSVERAQYRADDKERARAVL